MKHKTLHSVKKKKSIYLQPMKKTLQFPPFPLCNEIIHAKDTKVVQFKKENFII